MTLNEIGLRYRTDKCSDGKGFGHGYCDIYESYLSPLKNKKLVLLEIGIGGEEHIDRGGQSLRMWHDYLPQAIISGVDLYEKKLPDFDYARVQIFKAHQTDQQTLHEIILKIGNPDIIIDDGSHHNMLTSKTFDILFPYLNPGGLYFCEDVHTSYWKKYYEGNPNPSEGDTTMNFFKRLTDQLNHDVLEKQYKNGYAGQLAFIHFYHELVVIRKTNLL